MLPSIRSFFGLEQKFLVWNLVGRNLKLRYRRSALGYAWTLLIPLSTATIYYFLFQIVLKVQIPDFAAYVVTGILIWSFFAGTLSEGMESLMANVGLLLQVNVPMNVFPLTTSISNLTTLFFATPVILLVCLLNGIPIGFWAFLTLFYIALLFIQAYCVSYLLAISVIYVRDLRQVMGMIMQVWMYGTPVLYQSNSLPEKYHWVLYANPVGKIFAGVHNVLMRNLPPTQAEVFVPLIWTSTIFMITMYVHRRASKKALERV